MLKANNEMHKIITKL